ncbi:unnamed protein product [Spirodela intermedia]|uniref:Tify domain-containing protein n=1 Tax=Spirodela intermedia TaxID=51605 RepID=A0A7I8IK68_SPIIN|nr:unnamed protein product [Spirodela intermedia]CAA6657904.1 unnamed protein product [Spirodela intermedia]
MAPRSGKLMGVPFFGSCSVEESPPAALRRSSSGGPPCSTLTIFYAGRISVCKVTEGQAMEILAAAQRGALRHLTAEHRRPPPPPPPPPPQLTMNLGQSMVRSLHRFLVDRRARAATAEFSPSGAYPQLDHCRRRRV